MTAKEELAQYVGLPKCQDCGWKLGTAITNNCHCRGDMTPGRLLKYNAAFYLARKLQAMARGGEAGADAIGGEAMTEKIREGNGL